MKKYTSQINFYHNIVLNKLCFVYYNGFILYAISISFMFIIYRRGGVLKTVFLKSFDHTPMSYNLNILLKKIFKNFLIKKISEKTYWVGFSLFIKKNRH